MWSFGNEPAPDQNTVRQHERQIFIEAWNSVVDTFFEREGKHIANTMAGTVAALKALRAHIVLTMRPGDDTKMIESVINSHPRVVALKTREKNRPSAMSQALSERTKSATATYLPTTARPSLAKPHVPVAKKPSAPETQASIAERIHAAFLKGDVDALRKLGALEEGTVVASPGGSADMDNQYFEQEFFGADTTEAGVKQLMASYGNVRFVAVDQIYQLRNGDVVDFSGLTLQNGMKVPHFRIVQINSRDDSETEHILQCVVNAYYPYGNAKYRIIERATMEIKIPKPPKTVMGVRIGTAVPMLKEHQIIKASHITLGKDKDGKEIVTDRKPFLSSSVGGMRVFSNDKDAFEKGLLSPARLHRKMPTKSH